MPMVVDDSDDASDGGNDSDDGNPLSDFTSAPSPKLVVSAFNALSFTV